MEEKSIRTLTEKLFEDCETLSYQHLVDLGCNLAKDNLYSYTGTLSSRARRIRLHGCALDGAPAEIFDIFSNLYEDLYGDVAELPETFCSQAVYLGELYRNYSFEESVSLTVTLLDLFQTVYLIAPVADTPEQKKWQALKNIGSLLVTSFATKRAVLFRIEKALSDETVSIYVAAHKPCQFPKDPIYRPLWLGPADQNPENYEDDKQAPSIAHLNPRINECTGLYHIWKHATADVIGLAHYRRFLRSEWTDKQGVIVGREELLHLLQQYDIVLYQLDYFVYPLREQIKDKMQPEICDRAYEVFRRLIAERQPDYVDAYETVLNGHAFFPCNMFVARRPVFDAYCTWLFSFLTDAAKGLDYDELHDTNTRVAGFYAERMLTVWLLRQSLRIKELPAFLVAQE